MRREGSILCDGSGGSIGLDFDATTLLIEMGIVVPAQCARDEKSIGGAIRMMLGRSLPGIKSG